MDEHFQQLGLADATDIAGIDDLEENNCGAQGIPSGWPEWSLPPPLPPPYPPPLPPPLPPPDESFVKENVVEDAAKGDNDQDSSMQAAAEKGASFENNNSSTVQSLSQGKSSTLGLVPAVENGRSQSENSALAVIEGREEKLAASSVQAEYKQQSTDKTMTPSRPTTPESPRSTHDPVVTGQKRSRQNNAAAEAHSPGNGEKDLECRNQESDNPYKTATENDFVAENDLTENNNGLYAELQKEIW